MSFTVWKDNTAPSVTGTISSNGTAIDLTGATVTFSMRPAGSSTLKVSAQSATVVSAANGTVRYDWAAGQTDTAGDYRAWWTVTFSGGEVQDSPEFDLAVLAHAPEETSDLTTLARVREALDYSDTDTASDDLIRAYISRASEAVSRYTHREFLPRVTTTAREFRITSSLLSLAPYDLISVDSGGFVFDPNGTPDTLVADQDYALLPVNPRDGSYSRAMLSSQYAGTSTQGFRFGYHVIQITGTWGVFESVEDVADRAPDLEHAVISTVRSWMRRDTVEDVLVQPSEPMGNRPDAAFGLPAGVRNRLYHWRRMVVV